MASPREVAEKAFTLLQEALRDSEARADSLDEELRRRKPSKNQLEKKLDVITHRLETVEEEADRWQREAGQLEELVESERAKLAQLKKKLEVAESGPDKLTKKEVNFWRAKAEEFDNETSDYKSRIAALKKNLKERGREVEKLEDKLDREKEVASKSAEHSEALAIARKELEAQTQHAASLEDELDRLRESQKKATEQETAHKGEVQALGHQISSLDQALTEAHSGRASMKADLKTAQEDLGTAQQDLVNAREQLSEHEQSAKEVESVTARVQSALAERESRVTGLSAELEKVRAEMLKGDDELGQLRRKLSKSTGELDQLRQHDKKLGEELADARDRAQAATKERNQSKKSREELQKKLDAKIIELKELAEKQDERDSSSANIRDQLASLEEELKEEKERTENLSELANERMDQLNKLEEQVEEGEERLEESQWRLGKAEHFERLVRRRKTLVRSLIEEQRAKTKSNAALKAGLDSLRTFKAAAEANEQRLIAEVDELKTELGEAQEIIENHESESLDVQPDIPSGDINERLNAQAELIQSLEQELKESKGFQRNLEKKDSEVEDLRSELETKNQVITGLQSDVDEQQKKLAKLRGSDSETMRLKVGATKDRTMIDAMEREIGQLREALTRQAEGSTGRGDADDRELQAKLKEREDSVTRLLGAVKESEAKIAELTEAVDLWKRRCESRETPRTVLKAPSWACVLGSKQLKLFAPSSCTQRASWTSPRTEEAHGRYKTTARRK